MPIISLEEQGFNDPARNIMAGIAGFRAKRQMERDYALKRAESQRQDQELGLRKGQMDLSNQLLRKKLSPPSLADIGKQAESAGFEVEGAEGNPIDGFNVRIRRPVRMTPPGEGMVPTEVTYGPQGATTKFGRDPMIALKALGLGPVGAAPASTPPDDGLPLPPVGPVRRVPITPPQGVTTTGTQGPPRVSGIHLDANGMPTVSLEPGLYPQRPPKFVKVQNPDGTTSTMLEEFDARTGKVEYKNPPPDVGKVTERDQLVSNYHEVNAQLNDLENVIKDYGNFEMGTPFDSNARGQHSKLTSTEAAALLKQAPYQLAVDMAKVFNPGAVAREGMINLDHQYLIPMGMTVPNGVTLASITRLKHQMKKRGEDLHISEPEHRSGGPATSQDQALEKARAALAKGIPKELVMKALMETLQQTQPAN